LRLGNLFFNYKIISCVAFSGYAAEYAISEFKNIEINTWEKNY